MKNCPGKRIGRHSVGNHTAIELVGRDRPGLLLEISAVLADLQFNVAAAEVWTHNRRIACVLYVNDSSTDHAVHDMNRLSIMEEQLKHILRGCEEDDKVASTSFSMGFTHIDRRLHQMMFAERDYEGGGVTSEVDYASSFKPKITVDCCEEKGYSIVSVRCKDLAKLMFDIVYTLTDMQYVVFQANIWSNGPYASQEYFIRYIDGCTLDAEGEKERVVKCLEAAIHRRASETDDIHTEAVRYFTSLFGAASTHSLDTVLSSVEPVWVDLIMSCVTSVTYQIRINGSLTEAFTLHRSLR
ncbi:ACT domain-containing protein ACR3 [Hibiscus syriacus]|uniref:ACT domain-containing protein ACR n=1 Tax=Hibiscus syriacus TaxID=106335 RepID=A0A6A3BFG9_HIBSY|nr:ACT domain-containing protein ACR3 [Hibiscus syriacus]